MTKIIMAGMKMELVQGKFISSTVKIEDVEVGICFLDLQVGVVVTKKKYFWD